MKKLALVALLAPSVASAEYLGVGFGRSVFDVGDIGVETTYLSIDSDGNFKTAYIGKPLSPRFSIEGGYIDFGESSVEADYIAGGLFVNEVAKLKATAFFASGIASANITDRFSLFGKVGAVYWDATYTDTNLISDGFSFMQMNGRGSGTGVSPFFGVGAAFNLTDSISLRYSVSRYQKIGDGVKVEYPDFSAKSDGIDVDVYALAAELRF